MSALTEKDRLLRVTSGKDVDRAPVICPGGMMNTAVEEIVAGTGINLVEAHRDYKLMTKLAEAVQEKTGFENFGLPFCMTVEAEICGSEINFGSNACEPKIAKEKFETAAKVVQRNIEEMMDTGRIKTVTLATQKLAEYHPDTPVIATLTGPVSAAASIVEPMYFFRDLKKNPEASHKLMEYVTEVVSVFAERLIAGGATAIAIADPTATGELLSPPMFAEYAVPYLRKLVERIHAAGVPSIVHICGKTDTVGDQFQDIGANVISVDAMVNMVKLKELLPNSKTMGNLNTFVLDSGSEEKIKAMTLGLLNKKIDVISPACGLSMSTPVKNIRLMTEAAKGY